MITGIHRTNGLWPSPLRRQDSGPQHTFTTPASIANGTLLADCIPRYLIKTFIPKRVEKTYDSVPVIFRILARLLPAIALNLLPFLIFGLRLLLLA